MYIYKYRIFFRDQFIRDGWRTYIEYESHLPVFPDVGTGD